MTVKPSLAHRADFSRQPLVIFSPINATGKNGLTADQSLTRKRRTVTKRSSLARQASVEGRYENRLVAPKCNQPVLLPKERNATPSTPEICCLGLLRLRPDPVHTTPPQKGQLFVPRASRGQYGYRLPEVKHGVSD